ncbi:MULTISPECIES: hypothetical protein [Methylobacterium]|jgi:hypothetical protein|uniref:hypothetical protein n=1 Tax=Methylobacterium TaxID=407 RepID=UPI000376A5CB|nr:MULTISPECIES: hypothetical protein [Methylobacterium]MBN4098400.1 hypothetical protein [Methylobacterium sp. OT2]UIN37969.1 hypothetical protein LXM90_30110 [Methylobacterium oryzae]SEG65119.1 hypothetical protein SAMN04488144_13338 [Methylobacterium sp. 190mf]SEH92956.1 hypothetical protein SAMN02799636_04500 [Methylobacterium sp. 275MFSha3.1]SEP11666.1 hypothetical protein SAMN02799625_04706 [Methylobacterium sp. UNC300MFChir4.1]
MTVSDSAVPYVLGAAAVRSVEVIDGGGTLAIRLRSPDDSEFCVLLPIGVVGDLLFQLADVMSVSLDPRP